MRIARPSPGFPFPTVVLCAVLSLPVLADEIAQDKAHAAQDTITVTATRGEKSTFEVPASVDVLDPRADTLGVNLTESVSGVAGLLTRDRQNYAQDTQISIRGFGARSTFGIRGIRLYLDGIPATQPDGAGQVSHFNMATAERIEVLRGPFSALYGNSSGGVIDVSSAEGTPAPEFGSSTAVGDDHTWRASLGARGTVAGNQYNIGVTRFDTDGFRDHSQTRRDSFNGKFTRDFGNAGNLSLVLNRFDSPDTQDPLGLTREQFDQDPGQATSRATEFNTRKSVEQNQAGLVYKNSLDAANSIRISGYTGRREVVQFLAIPAGAQGRPTHSGGVIDLDSRYHGGDARWAYNGEMSGRPFFVVAGLNYEALSQDRRGFENFIGDTLGVRGELRRNETNDVDHFDQYLQVGWDPVAQVTLLAGVRNSKVNFDSQDFFVTDENPLDGGSTDFSATTPVFGALYRLDPRVHLYAAYGEGFETPTLFEIAYRADGGSGLNFDLNASETDNSEIGAKFRLHPALQGQLALFLAETEDELVVARNAGGRSTFVNAGETRRQGAELSLGGQLLPRLRYELAYTLLDAEVRETYTACSGIPCFEATTVVAAGNDLPGVPESHVYGILRWGGETGWQSLLEGRYVDAVAVNDANTESAPSYGVLAAAAGYIAQFGKLTAQMTLRVDNLFDEDHVGSVIVNDGNGRFYEPAPDRSVLGVIDLRWKN